MSDSKSIALNYLRGWFVVDLLAAMPFDHLYARDLYNGEVSEILIANRIILQITRNTIAYFFFVFFAIGTESTFRNPTFIW